MARHGHRVTQVNRPRGLNGSTSARDLALALIPALDHLCPDGPADVVAFSSGGATALALALIAPTRVRRLVLAGTAHRLGPVGEALTREALTAALAGDLPALSRATTRWTTHRATTTRLGGLINATSRRLTDHYLQERQPKSSWPLGIDRTTTSPASPGSTGSTGAPHSLRPAGDLADAVATLHADLTLARVLDELGGLSAIRTPTLVISGAADAAYPVEVTHELAQAIPSSLYLVYRASGHQVVTRPRFGRDVHTFLTQR